MWGSFGKTDACNRFPSWWGFLSRGSCLVKREAVLLASWCLIPWAGGQLPSAFTPVQGLESPDS